MYNREIHGFCSEFYTVEESIEVVVTTRGQSERIRIDALRDERTGTYCTKAYIGEHVSLPPTYPQTNGTFDRSRTSFRVWVDYELPWTDRESADQALGQALSFLRERCSNG